jgi:hypothetical protein
VPICAVKTLVFAGFSDHDQWVTSTLVSTAEPEASAAAPRKVPVVGVLVVALALVLALLAAVAATAHVVSGRTTAETRIQHHRGLALAAAPQLDRALQRALRMPVADRPASALPWLAGPQLGPGQPDVDAQGSPTIRTWLVRSVSDAVVAKMVIRSDGYRSTLIDKWFDGGSSSDTCGYGDLPGGADNAATCQTVIDSVPATKG